MLKAREDPDFARKAGRAKRRRELGSKHFDRDFAVMLEIPSQIDRGHAAGADLPFYGIALGEGGPESFEVVRHRQEPTAKRARLLVLKICKRVVKPLLPPVMGDRIIVAR